MVSDLSVNGKKTAETVYGARGWVAHHNTDLWRACGPIDAAYFGMWPNGGAWLTQHLWQHYLFTGDKEFLRRYYPVMKGAADFYLSHLVKHPQNGWLVTAPSVSPEHGYAGSSITAGCTMDNQIAFDALYNTMLAARILGESQAYQDSLAVAFKQLPPMQIGRHNQIQEWLIDADNPRDDHRHISHLYGLYPSNQISPRLHPELFQAAKNTLLQRGDAATGWSIGWKINFWARMLDGNHAYKIIKNMLRILPGDDKMREFPEGSVVSPCLLFHSEDLHCSPVVMAVLFPSMVSPAAASSSASTPTPWALLPPARLPGSPMFPTTALRSQIGRASCRERCRSRWSPYH